MPLKDSVGPALVAFGRVVVDDVQNHLEPGIVEPRHHLLEFAQAVSARRPRNEDRARRSRWCCSPSSSSDPLYQSGFVDEGVNGQQLDRRNAE